jgi:hypothetical protein
MLCQVFIARVIDEGGDHRGRGHGSGGRSGDHGSGGHSGGHMSDGRGDGRGVASVMEREGVSEPRL